MHSINEERDLARMKRMCAGKPTHGLYRGDRLTQLFPDAASAHAVMEARAANRGGLDKVLPPFEVRPFVDADATQDAPAVTDAPPDPAPETEPAQLVEPTLAPPAEAPKA